MHRKNPKANISAHSSSNASNPPAASSNVSTTVAAAVNVNGTSRPISQRGNRARSNDCAVKPS